MNNTTLLAATLALGAFVFAPAALAACEVDVEVGDKLEFSTKAIEVDATCESVTVNLAHTGTLPAAAMGHNWVLSATGDFQAIATAGMAAGLDQNYLPKDDARVIAATRVIGGGETTSVSFAVADLDPAGSYTFFCSFPGHWSLMNGTFALK